MWKFILSASELHNCFHHPKKEVAFLGPSNVGKSSLINALMKAKLARTSNTPGRTQLLNFFQNEKGWVLVDLPGYGYAKISKSQKQKMLSMVSEYLLKRENLQKVYLLIDARRGISERDYEIYVWLQKLSRQVTFVATKSDKLKQSTKHQLLLKVQELKIPSANFYLTSLQDKKSLRLLESDLERSF